MTPIPASQLSQRIQQLLDDREQHVDAIAGIDRVIAGIKAALSAEVEALTNEVVKPASAPTMARQKKVKRRSGRGQFAMSASESILLFVKRRKSPTWSEINNHLKSEGRSNSANNALGRLVQMKQLRRTPLGNGVKGSRYWLA